MIELEDLLGLELVPLCASFKPHEIPFVSIA